MTMEWNNRNDWFNSDGRNGNESFEDHNESMSMFCQYHADNLEAETLKKEEPYGEHDACMRVFAQSHASDLKVKVSRRDLINMMWPLLVTDTVKETGGAAGPDRMMDWSSLFPACKVAPHRFSQN